MTNGTSNGDAYEAAGVSINAAHEAVSRYQRIAAEHPDRRVIGSLGGFGGCFSLPAFRSAVLVASTDGVGSKVLIASALGRYQTVGADLVRHCINDVLCANARPLFFLDYLAVGKLEPDMAEQMVGSIARACAEYDVALLGGETAEMPDIYAAGHFDLAGTIVGAVEADALLAAHSVPTDDAIIGLAATGFHTNGYTLVRRVLPPDTWSKQLPGSKTSVADALLAEHPCYLSYIRAVQDAGVRIHGMAHITGGGLIDNVPRMLADGVAARLEPARWRVPPIIAHVAAAAQLSSAQAYRTFNMGVGFCFAVARSDAERALSAATQAVVETADQLLPEPRAAIIGRTEARAPGAPSVIIG